MANPLDTLQKGVQELISNAPLADIEKNIKAVLAQGLSKLDLVTREEYNVQLEIIKQLRARIEELEKAVNK